MQREIPRQELIDPALLVAIYDSGERRGQIGQRIDSIEFASLDVFRRANLTPLAG